MTNPLNPILEDTEFPFLRTANGTIAETQVIICCRYQQTSTEEIVGKLWNNGVVVGDYVQHRAEESITYSFPKKLLRDILPRLNQPAQDWLQKVDLDD